VGARPLTQGTPLRMGCLRVRLVRRADVPARRSTRDPTLRGVPMRSKIPFAPLMAIFGLACSVACAGADEMVWRSWDDGLREARETHRPILVDVYTNWCGWCRRMEREVYARDDVRDYLARSFVTIKLNAESAARGTYEGRSLTSRGLASRFQVRGYPTTLFLRSGAEHIVTVPGYVPADRFLLLLRYIGDGDLDRGTPFEEFVTRARRTPGP
jgi:thioredoxin-related protein